MTYFTIYEIKDDDNNEAIAIIPKAEMADRITTLLLKEGLDVWFEPSTFGKAYRNMITKSVFN